MLSEVLDPTCLTRGMESKSRMVPDTSVDAEPGAEAVVSGSPWLGTRAGRQEQGGPCVLA